MKKIIIAVLLTVGAIALLTVGNVSFAGMEMHHHHNPDAAGAVIVGFTTEPAQLETGGLSKIHFHIMDNAGNPVQDLTVTHERLVHVIIVSEDFGTFAHIHPDDFAPITPEMKAAANYSVQYIFPRAGRYIIGLDSAVKGMPLSRHFVVNVKGTPGMAAPRADFSSEKKFGDYTATLTCSPENIVSGKEILLKYTIQKDGKPVTDLEPYLAAPMHMAIVSSDLNDFIHEHGELPGSPHAMHHDQMNMEHMDMEVPAQFGPVIEAHVVFPHKGVYHIFSEIKHQGKVVLLDFMVKAEQGSKH